jgi:hypothetical protein
MNPKNVAGLDPKLRETYERVMGTSLPQKQEAPEPSPITANPQPQPNQQNDQAPVLQSASVPPAPQLFTQNNPFQEPPTPPAEVLAKNAVVGPEKKKNHFTAIGLGLGGVIFFIIYAVLWAKVFGLF